jgi:hypothetical protein
VLRNLFGHGSHHAEDACDDDAAVSAAGTQELHNNESYAEEPRELGDTTNVGKDGDALENDCDSPSRGVNTAAVLAKLSDGATCSLADDSDGVL